MPDALEPSPLPLRLRPDNPEYIAAWKALYGYKYDEMSKAHLKELVEAKKRVMREKGDGYPAWVLDQIGIETMFANRVAMGRGLVSPRFLWVPFADALMYPLDNPVSLPGIPTTRLFIPTRIGCCFPTSSSVRPSSPGSPNPAAAGFTCWWPTPSSGSTPPPSATRLPRSPTT